MRMKALRIKNMVKRIALFLSALALLSGAGSCAAWPGNESVQTETAQTGKTAPANPETSPETAAEPSTASSLPTQASGGILRLWWPPRDSLNPLHETTHAGQAVNRLVYQSLYTITPEDRIEADLAESMQVLEMGQLLLITIRPDITYHDGSPVRAADVAASLQQLIAEGNQSIWRSSLDAVQSTAALSEQVLEIRLNQPDPWIAWALTFPIIPADLAESADWTIIPGSGLYRIEAYDPAEGLRLVRVDANETRQAQKILVRTCRDQLEAMQALERDELDLVLLDTRLLHLYTVRSSLKIDFFSGNELIFASYNTDIGHLLHDAATLALLKQTISRWRDENDEFPDWAEPSPLGLPLRSWLVSGDAEKPLSVLLDEPAGWPENPVNLRLIAPVRDQRRSRFAEDIAAVLKQAQIPVTIELLETEPFTAQLTSKEYDLALLSAQLPDTPMPGFFLLDPLPDLYSGLAAVAAHEGGLADLLLWRTRWQQLQPTAAKAYERARTADPVWQEALIQASARSSWDSICLPHMGLVYGDRVSGRCRPSRYMPYENIEELWIWSGLSSSSS